MRILCVGDIHLSDKPPGWCTDDYLEDLFVILEHTQAKARELSVDAVVWAGDVFHHKAPSRTSHATVQRALKIIQGYGVPVFIVPGNHDMSYDRMDSIFATQPLGTLLRGGAVMLQGWADNEMVYGVPWLGKFHAADVKIALRDYRAANRPGLVVAHAPLFPPGLENPFECVKAQEWADAMGNQGYCYYGHVHEAHNIYEVNGVTFCNMGAISRGSLSEYDRDRAIKVSVWDENAGFQAVEVPYRPADEVFKVMQARAKKDAADRLQGFLSAVGQVRLEVSGPESVVRYVEDLELDPEIRALVVKLVREQA